MDTIRQNKVARLLQRELGEIFRKDGHHYLDGRMISVTVVRVSPDMENAKVYLSLFPVKNPGEDIETVRKHGKTIRYQLGKKVGKQIRVIPELLFFVDDTLDYIDHIDRLLK